MSMNNLENGNQNTNNFQYSIPTIMSIIKNGFFQIEQSNYGEAFKMFNKAMEISVDNIYVIIGMMLLTTKHYSPTSHQIYYSKIVEHSSTISKEEIEIINVNNCNLFFETYCWFNDEQRAQYVINNFKSYITTNTINIKTCKTKIDIVGLLFKSGIDIHQIFDAFLLLAYHPTPHISNLLFKSEFFPVSVFDRILSLGYNQNHKITFAFYHGSHSAPNHEIGTVSICEFFSFFSYDSIDFDHYNSPTSYPSDVFGKKYTTIYSYTGLKNKYIFVKNKNNSNSAVDYLNCIYKHYPELKRNDYFYWIKKIFNKTF